MTVVEGDPKAPFSIATTPIVPLCSYLIMLSVKQGSIKYYFLSLWYDSTWNWTQVSRGIGEHSTHYPHVRSMWNIKVTVIPIVIGVLGSVTKWLLKALEKLEIRGWIRPSKLQDYQDRPGYWETSWRFEETKCKSNTSEKPSANAEVKNSRRRL